MENSVMNETQKTEENHVTTPVETAENPVISPENTVKDDHYFKGLIEALLFIETEILSLNKIAEVLNLELKNVRQLVDELKEEHSKSNSGLLIVELANGLRLATNPIYGDMLKAYYKARYRQKFSKASLETLAIIAYKQPITRPEIEDIRGVSSDNSIKDLIEKKMIKMLGRKKVPGNPIQYGTTKDFLTFLGLKDVHDLPTLKEIKELNFD